MVVLGDLARINIRCARASRAKFPACLCGPAGSSLPPASIIFEEFPTHSRKMGSINTVKEEDKAIPDLSFSASSQGMLAYAPPSLFQPHNARQAIRDAHEKKIPPILCVYYGVSSVPVARLLAPFGFDAVWVDWEHTSCNVETMTTVRYLGPSL